MENMQSENIRRSVVETVSNILEVESSEIESILEVPSDRSIGDLALPCFKLAKLLKKAPPAIAKSIESVLSEKLAGLVDSVQATGPYLNIRFDSNKRAIDLFRAIRSAGDRFGASNEGAGKTIVLDYSSPNIAKPFSVGHLRSTIIGNAIANILTFIGYDCVRVNHLGDWGTQFGKLIEAYKQWGSDSDLEGDSPIKALLSLYVRFHQEAEKDPSWEDRGREWFKKLEDGDEEAVRIWKWFRDLSLDEFNRIYKRLGVDFDSFDGESFYNDKMGPVIERLIEKDLLVESQGAKIVDLEPYGLTPLIIQRSDDASLYATRDLAASFYRHETYEFHKNLYIVATQQNEHFKQLFKTIELLGEDWAPDCVHVGFGLISLTAGVMQSRTGNVIFLEDVLDQAVERVDKIIAEKNPDLSNRSEVAEAVGVGAIIFYDFSRRRIKDWTFDWNRILNFDGETGPYVMYSHARIRSILRKAEQSGLQPMDRVEDIDWEALNNKEALEVINSLEDFPSRISSAALHYEPNLIAQALVDIADRSNRFYNAHHVLVEDEKIAQTRLLLIDCVASVLKTGLSLLGVAAPEEM